MWKPELRTEDDVRVIEPRSDDGGNEELGTVGVLAGVSHGEDVGLRVLELEVFICSRISRHIAVTQMR